MYNLPRRPGGWGHFRHSTDRALQSDADANRAWRHGGDRAGI